MKVQKGVEKMGGIVMIFALGCVCGSLLTLMFVRMGDDENE